MIGPSTPSNLYQHGILFKINNYGPILEVGSAISLCFQGVKELYFDIVANKSDPTTPLNSCHKVELPSEYYLKVHGLTLLVSGILSGITCLQNVFSSDFRGFCTAIGKAANGSFIYASLLALEENIRIYKYAENHNYSDIEEALKHSNRLRFSAMLGIFSSLSYIISTALTLIGLAATVALVIGIIATFSGALKVIYDFISWSKEHAVHISESKL